MDGVCGIWFCRNRDFSLSLLCYSVAVIINIIYSWAHKTSPTNIFVKNWPGGDSQLDTILLYKHYVTVDSRELLECLEGGSRSCSTTLLGASVTQGHVHDYSIY